MIIKEDADLIQIYLSDASNYRGKASKVFIPQNQSELTEIIAECYSSKTPLTISGAGTGLTGGRCPTEGVIISTENLNKIIDIDYNKRLARVEPGVLLCELQRKLDEHGYFLPPNPTEINSSIGGNISTNASGSRSFKYGSYRRYVEELKLISASGVECSIRRHDYLVNNYNLSSLFPTNYPNEIELKFLRPLMVKNASGYYLQDGMDMIDLFIGSEGTLSIISEVVLKFDKKSDALLGFLVFFDDVDNMLKYVEKVRDISMLNNTYSSGSTIGISSRLIEYFDNKSLNYLSDKYPQIPNNARACIWTEQEVEYKHLDKTTEIWYNLIMEYTGLGELTWMAQNENEHERFRDFRHQIPLLIVDKVAKNGFRKIGTDTAVPREHFKDFYKFTTQILEKAGIENLVYGHIGDCHLHANLLPKNNKEFEKSVDIYNLIVRRAIEAHGTVSAEHGIGKLKKEHLLQMYGKEGIETMKNIKKYFDPENILGRGNLFDL